MNKRPQVWIVKEQVRRGASGPEAMDYTPAMKYGDLRFITDFDPPPHAVPGSSVLRSWREKVNEFRNEFDPETDWIIASGQPTAMMMVAYLLGRQDGMNSEFDSVHDGKARSAPRFLLWRREEGGYIPYDPLNIN